MSEKLLTKFILSFLIDKKDYLELNNLQQQIVFQTCRTIMMALYNAIKYENVYPVIMCGDSEAHKVIKRAIDKVSNVLPSTEKITIHIIH